FLSFGMANFRRLLFSYKNYGRHLSLKSYSKFHTTKFHFRFFNNFTMCNAQEYYFAKSQKGENYRLHVAKSKHLVGLSTTRGIRETNEDRCQVMVLELNEDKLKQFAENIVQDKVESDIDIINAVPVSRIEVEEESPECADFLTTNLHNRIEEVAAKDADDVVVQWRNIGG
ncbi:16806_t:CDS:2, partial [Entrophospora sp. SA101]